MKKQKFLQTKRGKVMLLIWGLITVWTACFLFSYSSENDEFRDYKMVQEELVEVIVSTTDKYNNHSFMSEEMVDHMHSHFSGYTIRPNDNAFIKQVNSNLNAKVDRQAETIVGIMKDRGYSDFDSYDVQWYLRIYSFNEFDSYDHFYLGIVTLSIIAVAAIVNAILVYFYKHPTQGSKNRTLNKLKKLDEMLGYGVISQTEYEQKKSILLASIQDDESNAAE